jgi:hypothetical protein
MTGDSGRRNCCCRECCGSGPKYARGAEVAQRPHPIENYGVAAIGPHRNRRTVRRCSAPALDTSCVESRLDAPEDGRLDGISVQAVIQQPNDHVRIPGDPHAHGLIIGPGDSATAIFRTVRAGPGIRTSGRATRSVETAGARPVPAIPLTTLRRSICITQGRGVSITVTTALAMEAP